MTPVSQVEMIAEYQRLLKAQADAHASKDAEAIDAADHDLAHFIRMNAANRLQEYFASRSEGQ